MLLPLTDRVPRAFKLVPAILWRADGWFMANVKLTRWLYVHHPSLGFQARRRSITSRLIRFQSYKGNHGSGCSFPFFQKFVQELNLALG